MGNYALFRPRDRENNFILSVAMTTVKMLFFVVLLIGVAALGLGIGLLVWVAKGKPRQRPDAAKTA